jgi:long-chain acyl-CoA synthetase
MFCYTSGTTGDAKGAKETHKAFVADMYFFDNAGFDLVETDVTISYLPYAHVYEQLFFVKSLCHGYATGYYSGDPLKLMEDILVLQPTLFPTVPRILNRIYSKIVDGVAQKSGFA